MGYMYVYMIHCDIDVHTECRIKGGFAPPRLAQPLEASCEVTTTIEKSPEDVYVEMLRGFKVISKCHPEWCPPPEEVAEGHGENETDQDDRAAIIKRKVEEGVKELLAKFEDKLHEQDEMFRGMMEG